MIDPANTRTIFVHGLASKPPEEDLHELWKKALLENIKLDRPRLSEAIKQNPDFFHSAYWANAVPDHLENTKQMVEGQRKAVEKLIKYRRKEGNDLHISTRGWVGAKVKKFGIRIVDGLGGALTIKDNIMHNHFREVRIYQGDQYIADRIRGTLEKKLAEAWDKKRKVVLITHSMGTFIAYDVLWRFSHRSEARFEKYRRKKVALFVTMGSPLGDSTLRDFMLTERWKEAHKEPTKALQKRYFPTNIEAWHNYAAYGDIVCHNDTLDSAFFSKMRPAVGMKKDSLRDYAKLYNPFIEPDGNNNPHKSYGYLIQPKLAQKLRELFGYS